MTKFTKVNVSHSVAGLWRVTSKTLLTVLVVVCWWWASEKLLIVVLLKLKLVDVIFHSVAVYSTCLYISYDMTQLEMRLPQCWLHEFDVRLFVALRNFMWPVYFFFFRFFCRDNYGFVTYMDTEDAKRAIEGTRIDTDVITTTDKLWRPASLII